MEKQQPLSLESELARQDRAEEIIEAAFGGPCPTQVPTLLEHLRNALQDIQALPRSPDRTRAINSLREAAAAAGWAARQ